MTELKLIDFPLTTYDKIRYSDTDRQGHINNAVFSTFLETGRVELLYNLEYPLLALNASFVIVSLNLDFLREITWPGQVDIGTGVLSIGNSSIKILQRLFQHDYCVAKAETVIVQVSESNGKSCSLSQDAKEILKKYLIG